MSVDIKTWRETQSFSLVSQRQGVFSKRLVEVRGDKRFTERLAVIVRVDLEHHHSLGISY